MKNTVLSVLLRGRGQPETHHLRDLPGCTWRLCERHSEGRSPGAPHGMPGGIAPEKYKSLAKAQRTQRQDSKTFRTSHSFVPSLSRPKFICTANVQNGLTPPRFPVVAVRFGGRQTSVCPTPWVFLCGLRASAREFSDATWVDDPNSGPPTRISRRDAEIAEENRETQRDSNTLVAATPRCDHPWLELPSLSATPAILSYAE
jgi:hypothetical protein